MNVNVNVGVAGLYRLQVHDKNGNLKEDTGWFKNLLTDAGLNVMATTGNGWMGNTFYAHVGTGNTAPAVTDTSLDTEIAQVGGSISASRSYVGTPDFYTKGVGSKQFALGAVVGNIAEVGFSKNGSTLASRALILDSGGSPTTITVTADDQLTVFYEFRIYAPTTDVTGTITNTDDSATYDYTLRACNIDSTLDWNVSGDFNSNGSHGELHCYNAGTLIGTIEEFPNSNNSNPHASSANGTWDAYSAGSYSRTRRWDMSTSQGNASGGIGAMYFSLGGMSTWQVEFTPAIPKDNTKVLNGFNATITWSRATI